MAKTVQSEATPVSVPSLIGSLPFRAPPLLRCSHGTRLLTDSTLGPLWFVLNPPASTGKQSRVHPAY